MRIDLEEMKIHLKTMSEKSIEIMSIHALAQGPAADTNRVNKLQEAHKSVL